MQVQLQCNDLPSHRVCPSDTSAKDVNWDFENLEKRDIFYDTLVQRLTPACTSVSIQCRGPCGDVNHRQNIDAHWSIFAGTVRHVVLEVFGPAKLHPGLEQLCEGAVPGIPGSV